MAGTKDSHVVEIPVDEEHKERQQQQQLVAVSNPGMGILKVIQQHPLSEISESPGHLLLLKLWQREEDLFCRRVLLKESRLESIKREIFQLCCFFLVFHGFFFTLVYSSSCSDDADVVKSNAVCKKWWIPSAVSLATSLVLVFLVQAKLFVFWKVYRGVHRERNDNRTLTRVVLPGLKVHPLRILTNSSYSLFVRTLHSFFNLHCGDDAFGPILPLASVLALRE
ncbi:unnamed protein product [Arabidopsis thaliana]|uniref:(thale cress) hypothetical protein n=1 Tax=Arabidopsis thaliana TaxID=3702 RepID=A0A7G2FKC0_ARATH|nr:unnamed protein product [Arabidopsis thaliana]